MVAASASSALADNACALCWITYSRGEGMTTAATIGSWKSHAEQSSTTDDCDGGENVCVFGLSPPKPMHNGVSVSRAVLMLICPPCRRLCCSAALLLLLPLLLLVLLLLYTAQQAREWAETWQAEPSAPKWCRCWNSQSVRQWTSHCQSACQGGTMSLVLPPLLQPPLLQPPLPQPLPPLQLKLVVLSAFDVGDSDCMIEVSCVERVNSRRMMIQERVVLKERVPSK